MFVIPSWVAILVLLALAAILSVVFRALLDG